MKMPVWWMMKAVWKKWSIHHCFLFKSDILTANLLTSWYYLICHAVYSNMHAFAAIPKASRFFEYIITECSYIIRNKPVHGQGEPVFRAVVFPLLDLDCNYHTQYRLAMLCVLVYISPETGLKCFGFAVAHSKWICKAKFFAKSRF